MVFSDPFANIMFQCVCHHAARRTSATRYWRGDTSRGREALVCTSPFVHNYTGFVRQQYCTSTHMQHAKRIPLPHAHRFAAILLRGLRLRRDAGAMCPFSVGMSLFRGDSSLLGDSNSLWTFFFSSLEYLFHGSRTLGLTHTFNSF